MSTDFPEDARVLVLGGYGFLGARITRALCDLGIKSHLLVRSPDRTARISDLLGSCITHAGDLANLDSLQSVIRTVRPDIIMHAAGFGSHRGEVNHADIFNNNVLAANNLLIATEHLPGCRIVFTGTSLEHGNLGRPLREEDPPDPVSYYAACKTAATLLVRQAARYAQRPITILRPFAIYGFGEPATRLIPTAIRAGLEGTVLKLTAPGFVRDYVFVEDVVDAYLRAATCDRVIGETINIAGGKATSNEAMVALVEKHLGREIKKDIGAFAPRTTDRRDWQADISRAAELLDWTPSHSLDEGIARTIGWFREHGFDN